MKYLLLSLSLLISQQTLAEPEVVDPKGYIELIEVEAANLIVKYEEHGRYEDEYGVDGQIYEKAVKLVASDFRGPSWRCVFDRNSEKHLCEQSFVRGNVDGKIYYDFVFSFIEDHTGLHLASNVVRVFVTPD